MNNKKSATPAPSVRVGGSGKKKRTGTKQKRTLGSLTETEGAWWRRRSLSGQVEVERRDAPVGASAGVRRGKRGEGQSPKESGTEEKRPSRPARGGAQGKKKNQNNGRTRPILSRINEKSRLRPRKKNSSVEKKGCRFKQKCRQKRQ